MSADGVAVAFREGDNILLGVRAVDDDGYGRLELVGGHPELGETLEQAARREASEEVGVAAVDLGAPSDVTFVDPAGEPSYRALIYPCQTFEGDPSPSHELIPKWFARRDVPYDRMWPADRYWLPLVLHGHRVSVRVESAAHDAEEVVQTVSATVTSTQPPIPDVILLVGPTSAGKSTLAPHVSAAVEALTGRACLHLSTDTIVAVQYPDRVTGPATTFETPCDLIEGRIVFDPHSRLELSERAVAGLGVLAAEFLSRPEPPIVLCEFPGALFRPLLDAIGANAIRRLGIWIAEVDAESQERHRRNRGRGAARLDPDAAIAMDSTLDEGRFRDDLLGALGSAVGGYVAVKTDGSLEDSIARVQRVFRSALSFER